MIDFKLIQHKHSFEGITKTFESEFADFAPTEKFVSVEKYFGINVGVVGSATKLAHDGLMAMANDFKGVYVFLEGTKPIYTGISRKVISRIHQHVKGKNHFSASLAFNIGKHKALIEGSDLSNAKRGDISYKEHICPAQKFLLTQNVAFHPMEDDISLYLFEVYCAMRLNTLFMNDFGTH